MIKKIKINFSYDYLVILLFSFSALLLEFCLTRILNFKTWNHVVYIVVPFAILGYGIGANLNILFQSKLEKYPKKRVLGICLLAFSLLAPLMALAIIRLPISVEDVSRVFVSPRAVLMLLAAYGVFIIPFVGVGFSIVYLFTKNHKQISRLYFFDLLGAGLGAFSFFYLLRHFSVFQVILLCSCLCAGLCFWVVFEKRRRWTPLVFIVLIAAFFFIPEPQQYAVEESKPDKRIQEEHQLVYSKWQPMGRTDLYFFPREQQLKYYEGEVGTFNINITPPPEYYYFLNDLVAGTPVFNLSDQGLKKHDSEVSIFQFGMEIPYVLLDKPRTLIIGAGGGRDIFIAKTHAAKEIIGAEINPVIASAMSQGGIMHEYSGEIYDADGVRIENVDGRYLVKRQEPSSFDLIILNGVDTFTGLSTGAYAYAESYLYTKNAMDDYLRVIRDDGIINFNRWLLTVPRESLRLFAIAFDSIKDLGYDKPWNHVVVGRYGSWSIFLIKKTPFTISQERKLLEHFGPLGLEPIFFPSFDVRPKDREYHPSMVFYEYAIMYRMGQKQDFERGYPFDISVITDNNPFFYKFYKLSTFNLRDIPTPLHIGSMVFFTQFLVFFQAMFFILLFILLPLLIFRLRDIQSIPKKSVLFFVLFFSCLGTGFMFIQMPFMQRFVLLLGSPIYALGVVLASLLVSAGVGSLCVEWAHQKAGGSFRALFVATVFLSLYLMIKNLWGEVIFDYFMHFPFLIRVIFSCAMIFPLGFVLGMFFPTGLRLVERRHKEAIAWAWGINCGFSVLGSIGAIILAQFLGFSFVIFLGMLIYLLALASYFMLKKGLG